MARKAGKIYGADLDSNSNKSSQVVNRNGGNQIWNDESKDNPHTIVVSVINK